MYKLMEMKVEERMTVLMADSSVGQSYDGECIAVDDQEC